VHELGLARSITFTGFIEDVPAVLAASDVVAHSSLRPEPFGLVMIEAMAASRPVVTPSEGGGLDIVVPGETGLLYEPGDPGGLASAIVDLLTWPERGERLGRAGRARVEALFGIDRFVDSMACLYRDAAGVRA
jgi:glycosyltransferase involved in cell wall biosynthesis